MLLHRVALCLSLFLVSAYAMGQDQQPSQDSGSANPLSGLNGFLKSVVSSINNTAAKIQAGTQNSSTPGASEATDQGRKLSDTDLANIFSKYPATGDGAPEWPRVAISIQEIPKAQLENHYMVHKPQSDECMRYSVKLWLSAKKSEFFKDLELCGSDIVPGVSFSNLMTWKSFPVTGKTAGQIRTGPTPPYNKLPPSPMLNQWLTNDSGYYYLGSLLYSMGYDWNYAPDSRRVWVAKVGK